MHCYCAADTTACCAALYHRCPQGESRLLRDEVHRLRLELTERQLALGKLRAKHEALVLKAREQDGERQRGRMRHYLQRGVAREISCI